MKKNLSQIVLLFVTLASIHFSCQEKIELQPTDPIALQGNNGNGNHSPAMVLAWNKAAIDVVTQTLQLIPDAPIGPYLESRYYAMVNIAMHDALNNIVPKYKRYALLDARDKDADADAAVAQAANDVIVAFYGQLNAPAGVTPQPVKNYISNLLQQSLASIAAGESKTKGITLGHLAARAILDKRNNDGIANANFPVTEGTLPGEYRFTFPFNGPPFNGLYAAPGWGNVTPFGMTTGAQFRPANAPYAVNSAAYTADYNEVKSLGRYNSSTRTADQTEIAKFWVESSPRSWNRIAVNIINEKNMNAWRVVRLLALLQIAEADSYISSFDAKLHYFYWRPVSAIHLAATDGNPNTTADPDWEVVGWNPSGPPDLRYWPTPPIPDYSSGHACAGGAGAELIKNFFGTDEISFSTASGTYPSTRHFTSLSQAARENSLSRIYVGYHFRKAVTEGEQQGKNVGKWIYDHSLGEE